MPAAAVSWSSGLSPLNTCPTSNNTTSAKPRSEFAWAAAILVIRGRPWRLSPFQLAPWQMLLGGTGVLPLAFALEGPLRVELNHSLLLLLLYNGPICIGFCGWASLVITRSLPAVTSSLSFLAVPAFGIAAAEIALSEPFDPTLLGGFALILAGMILHVLAVFKHAVLNRDGTFDKIMIAAGDRNDRLDMASQNKVKA